MAHSIDESFDVIVVGAGIFGSCAAYHSQRQGLKTLLLEQFDLGHSNGSSHGLSRIIRYAHTDSSYVPLVDDAYRQIEELEKKTGEKLWIKTGLLWTSSVRKIDSISSILRSYNVAHEVVKGTEIAQRYPQFKYDNDWSGLIDPMGGMLLANKWLQAFQKEFVAHGGIIRDNEEVLDYHEHSDGSVTVKSSKTEYKAKKVVFTVGVWIQKHFPTLPLIIQPQSLAVCYWKAARAEDAPLLESGKFPVFIASNDEDSPFEFFGLPVIDYPESVKICSHSGQPIDDGKYPDVISQKYIDDPSKFIREHVPVLDSTQPTHVDKCKYTVSEDHHYVIDYAPGSKSVLIGGCGSGSGFKVAPAIGRILGELAAGKTPSIDYSFFTLKRFQKAQ